MARRRLIYSGIQNNVHVKIYLAYFNGGGYERVGWVLCVTTLSVCSYLTLLSSMPHNDLLEGAIVLEEFCKVISIPCVVCAIV